MSARRAFPPSLLRTGGTSSRILIGITPVDLRDGQKTGSRDDFFIFSVKFADSERFIYLLIRPP